MMAMSAMVIAPWDHPARWRQGSDFADESSQALTHRLRAWLPPPAVAGVGAAVFAVGFTEACLHLEQRPIPLRFALRYALYNVLPSAVWKSISAPYIADLAGVPAARLVVTSAAVGATTESPARRRARVQRLVTLQSLRALRCVIGSYGFVWAAWRWHCSRETGGDARAPRELVLRVASPTSALSAATRRRHGDHVEIVPLERLALDARDREWGRVGLQLNSDGSYRRLVIEAELSPDGAVDATASTIKGSCPAPSLLVGVVPLDAAPPQGALQDVDVCIFALSIVVRFLSEQAAAAAADSVTLLSNGAPPFAQRVGDALRWRHDLVTRLVDATAPPRSAHELPVVIAASVEEANELCARLQQAENAQLKDVVVVVVEAPAAPSRTQASSALGACKAVLSVADATDRVLQQVRARVRAGAAGAEIQREVLGLLGEQRSLLQRPDRFSRWEERI
ncbi:hypothetical protein P43SY_000337 [Pythium insidiosum]|uniref:Uncharacterized protein n=1 Tax=Pythium insidiosum TaxID=114742 RepID=A0AAD5Q1U2_PYTIN|nr:hypothetical protein P43SY_000337 [Pythium insidiosum]